MARFYRDAELTSLGQSVIETDYSHLKPLSIEFLFREEGDLENGKIVPGSTIKPGGREYTLHRHDFVISIAADVWGDPIFTADFQYALLDHYLAYCGVTFAKGVNGEETDEIATDPKTGRFLTHKRIPDVQEFEEVLVRHGAYNGSLRSFLKSFAERRELLKKQERETKKIEAEAIKAAASQEAALFWGLAGS